MTKVKDDTLPEIEIELEEVTPLNNMESIEEQPEAQVEEVSAFETVFLGPMVQCCCFFCRYLKPAKCQERW